MSKGIAWKRGKDEVPGARSKKFDKVGKFGTVGSAETCKNQGTVRSKRIERSTRRQRMESHPTVVNARNLALDALLGRGSWSACPPFRRWGPENKSCRLWIFGIGGGHVTGRERSLNFWGTERERDALSL
jgi:hypothetical protein